MGPPYLPSMIGLTPGSYRSAAAKRLLHAATRMRGAQRAEIRISCPADPQEATAARSRSMNAIIRFARSVNS